jgi:hypothetical protein
MVISDRADQSPGGSLRSHVMSTPAARPLSRGLVAAGGALFAVGNLLHPLEHSAAAHASATWEAAHLVFALGGLLLAAGLPLMIATAEVIRASRLALAGGVMLAVAFAAFSPGAWFEAYVAPLPGGAGDRLESGPGGAVLAATGMFWLVAVLVFGIALVRRDQRRPVRLAGAALLAVLVVLVAFPGLPGREGLWIIPATVVAGLAFVGLAVTAPRAPEPVVTGTPPLPVNA